MDILTHTLWFAACMVSFVVGRLMKIAQVRGVKETSDGEPSE